VGSQCADPQRLRELAPSVDADRFEPVGNTFLAAFDSHLLSDLSEVLERQEQLWNGSPLQTLQEG
jgi:hypothetical protein